MKKMIWFIFILPLVAVIGCAGGVVNQAVIEVSECPGVTNENDLSVLLMKNGYLRSSERTGPLTTFQKTEIEKKSKFSSELYGDQSVPVPVAYCQKTADSVVLFSEQQKPCPG